MGNNQVKDQEHGRPWWVGSCLRPGGGVSKTWKEEGESSRVGMWRDPQATQKGSRSLSLRCRGQEHWRTGAHGGPSGRPRIEAVSGCWTSPSHAEPYPGLKPWRASAAIIGAGYGAGYGAGPPLSSGSGDGEREGAGVAGRGILSQRGPEHPPFPSRGTSQLPNHTSLEYGSSPSQRWREGSPAQKGTGCSFSSGPSTTTQTSVVDKHVSDQQRWSLCGSAASGVTHHPSEPLSSLPHDEYEKSSQSTASVLSRMGREMRGK